jgi:nitroimidazol reductase NimA-like FMN-containing flavoprotein (pyridoxamine 5'-phosphate oxidase superfamily)
VRSSHATGGEREHVQLARSIIEANLYMTLATADGEGLPWASPVWYAHSAYSEFLWVSNPEARHSRNITTRAQVAIVIFDSSVPVGEAQAVYVDAVARELSDSERQRAIEIFSGRSEAQGAGEWTTADVIAPAPLRLYRAAAVEAFVLQGDDRRLPIPLASDDRSS